jgi:hypothetical protein
MSAGTDISALYREFTDALTEVLVENAGNPVRRGRLARARAAVKRHPNLANMVFLSGGGRVHALGSNAESWSLA